MESELDGINFEALVSVEADDAARPEDVAVLRAHPQLWASTLWQLIIETDAALANVSRSGGDDRAQILADLSEERATLDAALRRLTGAGVDPPDHAARTRTAKGTDDVPVDEGEPRPPVLQASWFRDEVVLWAGSRSSPGVDRGELDRLLAEAGVARADWHDHRDVNVPGGATAAAVAAPMGGVLGWLVGAGAGQVARSAGAAVRWLGEVAAWATDMVASGRMVPTMVASRNGQATAKFWVRWVPAVVDEQRLQQLSSRMPGAVGALDPASPRERLCRSVLAACVDAVCQAGAARLVSPATVPVARRPSEVGEAVLAGLDGSPFTATIRAGSDMVEDLRRWSAPVTRERKVELTVRLAPPGPESGWLLSVEAGGAGEQAITVGRALAEGAYANAKAQAVEVELRRLERLVPALRRGGRRGQVVLDVHEAWTLMSETATTLVAAGFRVRVPAASGRRPAARLNMAAEPLVRGPSVAGAQQLSRVRWSVLLDDVELDAPAIAKLAREARPLLRVGGRWVELDRADLDAASKVLADHAAITELSGGAILRHAVGLEGNGLAGPVSVAGSGWAVDLVQGATANPPGPLDAPEGFVGELRSYQAEARGWLAFLDRAGLGGCLAMDMGLGKTPTVLAHLLEHRGEGPALVITPPAVLGNWVAEGARFTPGLRVKVHHGARRVEADAVADLASDTDVVLTTYATAVRDVDALAEVAWHRIVVDEAQTIKNVASDTAQQLRRLRASSRLALTGTPIENGLGDLWAIVDFTNPGLVGPRAAFVERLSKSTGAGARGDGSAGSGDAALRALNGLILFRRSKAEPEIAAELPDKIDELDHCGMTPEQVGLYQAVLDRLLAVAPGTEDASARKGQVLAAITALKQVCDHPAAYLDDDRRALDGRSGKLARLEELIDSVFAAGERMLVFTHFARWGTRLAAHLSERTGLPIACYHGGLTRGVRDRLVQEFQDGTGPGALVLSIKAGGSGLNLTAANHVVLYDRWWNPAVEDQARDRAWRIGQANTVISHRLVCPGTIDERVEEIVAGKRHIADLVLPAKSSLGDLGADQLRLALGLRPEAIIDDQPGTAVEDEESAA